MKRPVLFELSAGGAAPVAVLQGATCALAFARQRDRAAFVELLLLGADAGGAPPERFQVGRWECRRRVAAGRIGLVSQQPHLFLRLSVFDNLALADDGAPRFAERLARCLAETGLLADVDPRQPAATLDWTRQVQLNFVQAWLREPECLLFDAVFDHDDGAGLLDLPRLFRSRYPFRAVCHLAPAGRLPAALGVTEIIDIA
ncbi:hypothetical protein [Massilia niastensis]|uniref:hypothetical protein n=1 Tax=Massilia niastensis TaxID=544911 RepID=UPI0003722BE3|nr:hypothetical protein [Massilia niastensis]